MLKKTIIAKTGVLHVHTTTVETSPGDLQGYSNVACSTGTVPEQTLRNVRRSQFAMSPTTEAP